MNVSGHSRDHSEDDVNEYEESAAAVLIEDDAIYINCCGTFDYNPTDAVTSPILQGLDDAEARVNTFTYTLTSGKTSETVTAYILVQGANDAPVAVNDTASVDEDSSVTISAATLLANDTDVDGEPLSINGVGGAVNGTVTHDEAGDIIFTPEPGYVGEASFTYDMTDGTVTKTATVAVTVNDVGPGLPPEKWSSLRYSSEPFGGRIDVEEEAQA